MYDLLLFQCGARSDNRVFIYFTTKITFFTIREFLEKNIENFKKSSTARKILVLSGIHGSDSGQAKSPEDDREEYFKGWNANFEKIQDQYKAQGITLNLVDISEIFECNEENLTLHVQNTVSLRCPQGMQKYTWPMTTSPTQTTNGPIKCH